MQVRSDPRLDALKTLNRAIENVEARVVQNGLQRLPGGYWGNALDTINDIRVQDTGPPQSALATRHLNWPVLRDGLKALRDFIADRNLTHSVRGLEFGINSGYRGQVGVGSFV